MRKNGVQYSSYRHFGSLEDEYVVTLIGGDPIQTANRLYETGDFEYATPCFYRKIGLGNPLYSRQWGFNNQSNPVYDINPEGAWKLSSGKGVTVAVVDNGVDLDHPDLKDNVLSGYDAISLGNSKGGNSEDDWHGTSCAGIIAACDNSIGVKGVAYSSKIYPVRITKYDNFVSDKKIAEALINAYEHADVISCSWQCGSPNSVIANAITSALTKGRSGKGSVVVFITGNNDKSTINFPANSTRNVIAVGAMNQCGQRKSVSTKKCDGDDKWGSNYGAGLDVIAPGISICTTTDEEGEEYTYEFSGTSAACPHVAGVAALMLSVNPNLTAQEVHDIINATATKLPNYPGDWNTEVGHGLVNAEAAVTAAHLNTLSISGGDVICDAVTYIVNNLPAGATVEWSYEGNGAMTFPKSLIVTELSESTARYERGEQVKDESPYYPPIIIGTSTDAGTKPTAMPTEPYTGTKVITATISLNGAEVTLKKTVNVGTLTKPELLLNGFKYLYNEPMAPGKIGQTYTFSCENVDKGKLIWEVKAPGADPYTKTNVSSVSITPATSGAISVTVTNTDGCPEDNHASGTVVIMPSIVIDPINPVNPGITINARVWSERATGDDGGAMTKAAAAETARVPYEGGYTVELWDDRTMLGRWQREGHVMEIPGTGTLSGRIYYLRLYVDGELADVAKVMVY